MDLLNETPYPAAIFRTVLAEDLLLAAVVVKVTYTVSADGRVARDAANPVPIAPEPVPVEYGELPSDIAIRKEGADLFVLGNAYAPGGRPATAVEVELAVSEFRQRLAVLGDRRWKKGLLGFSITEPQPFTALPLTWDRAFGGEAKLQEKGIPHPDNGRGRGYILEKSAVDGTSLPNLEDPDHPILSWEDRPRPLCFAPIPMGSAFQTDGTVEAGEDRSASPKVLPSFFNMAHPKLRVPALVDGSAVSATNVTPDGIFRFAVPVLPLFCDVTLEDRRYQFPAHADTLCLLPEERRFFVVYRCSYKYRFRVEEKRLARLREGRPDREET